MSLAPGVRLGPYVIVSPLGTVEVKLTPSFAAGIPRALFELPDSRGGQWDVTAG